MCAQWAGRAAISTASLLWTGRWPPKTRTTSSSTRTCVHALTGVPIFIQRPFRGWELPIWLPANILKRHTQECCAWTVMKEPASVHSCLLHADQVHILNVWLLWEFRVGIQLSKVEVRFENLAVTADVHVGGRALPTVLNSVRNFVEVSSLCYHVRMVFP